MKSDLHRIKKEGILSVSGKQVKCLSASVFALFATVLLCLIMADPASASNPTKPKILYVNADDFVYQGEFFDMEVFATGDDLTYQWQAYGSKWNNLSDNNRYFGTNTSHFRVKTTNINPESDFDWIAFRCKVSNSAGSTTSREFHVVFYTKEDFYARCDTEHFNYEISYATPDCPSNSITKLKVETGKTIPFFFEPGELPEWLKEHEHSVINRIRLTYIDDDLHITDQQVIDGNRYALSCNTPQKMFVELYSGLFLGDVEYDISRRTYFLDIDDEPEYYDLVELSCELPESGTKPVKATSDTPGVFVSDSYYTRLRGGNEYPLAEDEPFRAGSLYRINIEITSDNYVQFRLGKTKFTINGETAYVSGIVGTGSKAFVWLTLPEAEGWPIHEAYLTGDIQPIIGGTPPELFNMIHAMATDASSGAFRADTAASSWYRIPADGSFEDRVPMANGEKFNAVDKYCLRLVIRPYETSGSEYRFVNTEENPLFIMLNGNAGTETVVDSNGKRAITYVFIQPEYFSITDSPESDVLVEVGETKYVPVTVNAEDKRMLRYTWQGKKGDGDWEDLIAGGTFYAVDWHTLTIVCNNKKDDGMQLRCKVTGYGMTLYSEPVILRELDPKSLRLPDSVLYLTIGDTKEAELDPKSDAPTNNLQWSSSEPKILSVNASTGKLTAKKTGSATIFVKSPDGRYTASRKVRVEFKDVKKATNPKAYYYDPVYWAADRGITGGVKDSSGQYTLFDPNASCTRAQMVTFLWRYCGCPEPKSSTCSFTDVKEGSYYYKAVIWGTEKGIVGGYSDNTFRPGNTCSRSQAITFLYRMAGSPKPVTESPVYSDAADKKSYYYKAVLWGVENGIVGGYPDHTFKPSADCSRAQIVTFLYRYEKESKIN